MRLTILGRPINVVTIADNDIGNVSGDPDSIGYFEGDTIYLASSLQGEKKKRVLLHELTHAVFSVSGLTNLLDPKLEEAACDALETLAMCYELKKEIK